MTETQCCVFDPVREQCGTVNVEIREAREEDFVMITSIYAYHVKNGTGSFEIEQPGRDEMLMRWRKVKDRNGVFLVAINEDGIAGFAYAGPYNSREAYKKTVEDSVYICPYVLHTGVGTKLLSALIEACRAKGFTQMVSVIGDSENRSSIGLHEKLGFKHVGVFKSVGEKFGRILDVVLMQKAL